MNNEEFVIYQYDDEGKCVSTTTLRFQKPKPNRKYTFDMYAGFKVNPDTYSIQLERFALDKWGVIRPVYRSKVRVPFCKKDFDCHHKTNRMMYLSATFCGKRVFYEYHYGTLKHIEHFKASNRKLPKINISDIPREYRDALL
jgi:hypothetical protein